MERLESTDPVRASRGPELSALRQVAVFAVAAVSVVVFVRLGKYLGQRFGFSPPLTAALVPIVPTAGAALIAKRVLTPRVKAELQPKPISIDEVDDEGLRSEKEIHLTSEWTASRRVLTDENMDVIVTFKAKKGFIAYTAKDEDIKWAAKTLVEHTHAKNYERAKEPSLTRQYVGDEHQLKLSVKGFRPKNAKVAEAIIRRAIKGETR